MQESDDFELLQRYVRNGSETAFAALVSRYVNLVYSAALRCVGDTHNAEEISQAVFIILARRSRNLRSGTVLSGWLYQTTRFTAANFLRKERRRTRREQESYMQSTLNESNPLPQITPWLDAAIGNLPDKDRNAVLLRYFDNKSLRDVGAAFGTSEEAAKMRVNRALEKMRKFFLRRGLVLNAGGIEETMSAYSVQSTPIALTAMSIATAMAGPAASPTLARLVQSTLKLMMWTRLKPVVGIAVGLVIVAGASTVLVGQTNNPGTHRIAQAPANEPVLIDPGVSVGKVKAGMTEDDVIAALGEPERRQGNVLIYDAHFGFSVACNRQKIVGAVFCGDSLPVYPGVKIFKGRTREGIGMGSTRTEIVKAFGKPTENRKAKDSPDQEQLTYGSLGLTFFLSNEKVFNIIVDFRKPK